MKRIFFTLIIACSMVLVCLPLERSLSAEEFSGQTIDQHNSDLKATSSNGYLNNLKGPVVAKKSNSHCDNQGPTGCRGPRGRQGDTGDTGPTGSAGVSSAYGSFFTQEISITQPLAPLASINFTSKAYASSDVSLMPNGIIQLNQTGDYLVVFGASPFHLARLALTINGNVVPGTNMTVPSSVTGGQLTTLATTIRVAEDDLPAMLQVINNGSSSFSLVEYGLTGPDITAFITVEKINDLPNP